MEFVRTPPNPIRLAVLAVGFVLVRLGVLDRDRARKTADLAWPRIVTGIARMSKNAVDVAMVGIAVGSTAIAGVGFAESFWGLAFSAGGGIAAGTLALISQRHGAGESDDLAQSIRSSVAVVVALTLPIAVVLGVFSTQLVSLLSTDPRTVSLGASYLRVVALGVPFAALNLVGSRVFIGVNDARTPMLLRSGGAVLNVVLNTVFIFGLGLGVVGAALGTVVSNACVTGLFAAGLATGDLPGIGAFPVTVDPFGSYVDRGVIRDVIDIGTPVIGRNLVWTLAEFPMLAIVGLFGTEVVAAYVIARRIWGIMNTPGWGFGLASSSLVGQALGKNRERIAASYGREIVRFAVAVYILSAGVVLVFADPIVLAFVGDRTDPAMPVAVSLVSAASVAIVLQGISGGAAGPLDASGDTRWPFYSQALGMFGCSIPLAYLGATTSLGIYGLYLAFLAETGVPAVLNYYRLHSGKWKQVSRSYRPDTTPGAD